MYGRPTSSMTHFGLQDSIQHFIPKHPTPRLLPVDIHGNSRHRYRYCRTADHEECISHALDSNPIICVECQTKCEHVFDEIHDRECFGGLFAMAVAHVCDNACRAELYAEVDKAHADDNGNGPWVLFVERFAPRKESSCREDEICNHHWEAEFGL